MTGPVRLLVCLALSTLTPGLRAADPLAEKLDAVMNGKDYAQARWGVLVADLKTGEPLYARSPDKLITPASTTKLFSCAAVLVAYGPDYRFVTPVHRRGVLTEDGVLKGDLILVASGDPSFGGRTTSEGKLAFTDHDHTYANSGLMDSELTGTSSTYALDELARKVKAAGVKSVEGDVVIDNRLFARAQGTGSGPSVVSPITVNDNVIDVVITPGARPGDLARVATRPESGFYRLDAEVATGTKESEVVTLLNVLDGNQVVVRGSVPAGGKPVVRIAPVDDPALFGRALFVEALRRQGVRVAAPVGRPVSFDLPPADGYDKLPKVGDYTSPPLSELTKVTLKVSHNLYASTLPMLLAAKHGQTSLDAGLREQGKVLKGLGVDVGTISFGGGAGGAPSDCVTPRAVVQLLIGLRKRPEWEAYRAGLTSLGVDGTLVDVVDADSPAKGKAFAKTGTLLWPDAMNGRLLLRSKALAGVTTTKAGREVAIAFFVNDVPLPPGVMATREGKVLGKLAEIVYEYGE